MKGYCEFITKKIICYPVFMEYIGARTLTKTVGRDYSLQWDKQDYTVRIFYRSSLKRELKFNKWYESAFFYNRIKKLKDVKQYL